MQFGEHFFVGQSQPIRKIKDLIRHVANSDLNVLICGETGVGKEVVAHALHFMSDRRNRLLIKVNCAAIPAQLLESELFGYEKGAFTGAEARKIGKFELAHKSTILLDEIADMPLPLQAKMLQVLQDLRFSRLGGKKDIQVDCWVLAATNQEIEHRIKQGLFREDLYYRLNIIRIYIPPLRERKEDIEPLIHYFAQQSAARVERPRFHFDDNGVVQFLREYSWPGNVRELRSTVNRLILLGDWPAVKAELMARASGVLESRQKPKVVTSPDESLLDETAGRQFPSLKDVKRRAVQEAESKLIRSVLIETGWNRKKAASILQISYKALLYKIKQYEVDQRQVL
ncbi:MAG: sigma-54-dependent Fis family transcriptional regulator [Deltaproteobacteria bacterium]|nr:sigma-54-dependent Fis family transcriptional regulator [Deltaproteobacteria bacterium]MBW2070228.1 sigma-54-dependent Fis family transcriptional regulator [Deltaproteobacteria bacterium]